MQITSNKIWFSDKPDVFLPESHQQKLFNFIEVAKKKEKLVTIKIRLIIWKEILNEDAVADAESFCQKNNIELLDLNTIYELITSSKKEFLKQEQLDMLEVAKIEIKEWINDNSGNPATPSDLIRLLPIIIKSTVQKRNYYSDFDVDIGEELALIVMIATDKYNFILPWELNGTSLKLNNNVLYFFYSSFLEKLVKAIHSNIYHFKFVPKIMSEHSMREFLSEYPGEIAYFPVTLDKLFANNNLPMLRDNALENIRKRELLQSHTSPIILHEGLTSLRVHPIHTETIKSVSQYCGPYVYVETLKKFFRNPQLSNHITSIAINSDQEESWHPLSSLVRGKNKYFLGTYQHSECLHNFIFTINHIYHEIGKQFFHNSSSLDNLFMPSLYSNNDIGIALYRYKSSLTRESFRFLYNLTKSNISYSTPFDYWIAFNGILLKKNSGIAGHTFEDIFTKVMMNNQDNNQSIASWLDTQSAQFNNIPMGMDNINQEKPAGAARVITSNTHFKELNRASYVKVAEGIYQVTLLPIFQKTTFLERNALSVYVQVLLEKFSEQVIVDSIHYQNQCVAKLDFIDEEAAHNFVAALNVYKSSLEKECIPQSPMALRL